MPWRDKTATELQKGEQCNPQEVLRLLQAHEEDEISSWALTSLKTSSFIKLLEILKQGNPFLYPRLFRRQDHETYLQLAAKNQGNPGTLLFMQIFDLHTYFSQKTADSTHMARWKHFMRTLAAIENKQPLLDSLAKEAKQFKHHGITAHYATRIQALIDTAKNMDSDSISQISLDYKKLIDETATHQKYGEDWRTKLESIKQNLMTADIKAAQTIYQERCNDSHLALSPEELRIPSEIKEHNTQHPETAILVALYQVALYSANKIAWHPEPYDPAVLKWKSFLNMCVNLAHYANGDDAGLKQFNDELKSVQKKWSKGIGGILSGGLFGQQTQHFLDLIHTLEWTLHDPSPSRPMLPKATIKTVIDSFLPVAEETDQKIEARIQAWQDKKLEKAALAALRD